MDLFGDEKVSSTKDFSRNKTSTINANLLTKMFKFKRYLRKRPIEKFDYRKLDWREDV